MRKIILSLLAVVFVSFAHAQFVRTVLKSSAVASNPLSALKITKINIKEIPFEPSVVKQHVKEGDFIKKKLKNSEVLPVDIQTSLGNVTFSSKRLVWTLKISVKNATSLSVIFDEFNLADNALLYVISGDQEVLDGPVSNDKLSYSEKLATADFSGNSLILLISEPAENKTLKSNFKINKVLAGIIPATNNVSTASTTCIPSIACEPSKLREARGVARFKVLNYLGTGTLLNNENNDRRPLLLTAFHVLDINEDGVIDPLEVNDLLTSVTTFQYWSTDCSGTPVQSGISFSGAILLAQSKISDVALIELLNPPGIGDQVNFVGWNRGSAPPPNHLSFIIHHPSGQDMRITKTSYVYPSILPHFFSAKYSSGVTTPGSSGSALFNGDGQVSGHLSGGSSSCTLTDLGDDYGMFYSSWNLAGLQQFLSPAGNYNSINTNDYTTLKIEGPEYVPCSGQTVTYTLPQFPGCTYEWSVAGALEIVSGQGSAMVSVKGLGVAEFNGRINVTIHDSKGFNRELSLSKYLIVGTTQPIEGLAVAKSGPSCSTGFSLTLSLGAEFNGNTGCALGSTLGVAEVDWEIYSPYPFTKTNNAGIYQCVGGGVNNVGISVNFSVQSSPYVVTIRCRTKNACGFWGDFTPGFSFTIRNCNSSGFSAQKVKIYPNPAASTLHIDLGDADPSSKVASQISSRNVSYRILNFEGQTLLSKEEKVDRGIITTDVTNIPRGRYFLHLTVDGVTSKHNILIER